MNVQFLPTLNKNNWNFKIDQNWDANQWVANHYLGNKQKLKLIKMLSYC